MKARSYEKSLPNGYRMVKKMDAADIGFGLLLTLGSLLLFAVCLMAVALPFALTKGRIDEIDFDRTTVLLIWYLVGTAVYTVLHELTHGVAYKALTGQKLSFGIKWNCAYCGVPNIFTYRRTSLIALYAPFTVYTVIMLPALVWAWFANIEAYFVISLIFATHISGCIGDLYMGHILLTKYKSPLTLINDTGPCVRVFTFDIEYLNRSDKATEAFKAKFNN